jgi:hypothetical protein
MEAMRYLVFNEPGEPTIPGSKVSREVMIPLDKAIDYVNKMYPETFSTDDEALDYFKVTHWAMERDDDNFGFEGKS